jgi:nucleoside-diphosphate-sugar epimerase
MPDQTQVTVGDPARPGNLYGATKVWAEALGASVAATTPTSVVNLRIGYFSSQRLDAGTVSRGSGPELLGSNDDQGLLRRRIGCEWRPDAKP